MDSQDLKQSNEAEVSHSEQSTAKLITSIANRISHESLSSNKIESRINEEVINKRYSALEFSQFIDSYKEDTSNNLWTDEKLEKVIEEFKAANQPSTLKDEPIILTKEPADEILTKISDVGSVSSQNLEESKSSISNSDHKEKSLKKAFTQIPKVTDINGEVITEMMYVRKLQPTELSEQNPVFVRIDKAEPVKGGLFSKDFIQYKIQTNPLGWLVDRSYNDFFWLKSVLQKLYPRLLIPNIPKRQNKEKFTEDSVKKRIYIFERFLNTCIADENIKSEPLLNDFLSISDNERFKTIKSNADRLPKPVKVEEMWSKEGQVPLDLRADLSEYSKIAETYCVQTEPVLKEIRHLSKRLALETKQISSTINELGDRFGLLQGFSSFYNQKICRDENNLDTIYSTLQRTLLNWSEKMQEQVNIIKKSFVCFFKYNSYENEYYKEMNQRRTRLEEEYLQQKQDLLAKKEKLFKLGDINKWNLDSVKSRGIPRAELISNQNLAFDVMLHKETEELRKKRDMYGVLNYSVCREIIKVLKRRCRLYQENFKNFATKQLEYFTEMQLSWSSLAGDMEKLKVDGSRIWE